MAITALEFMVLSSFREHGLLPVRPRVLELGGSNWYGDVPLEQFEQAIRQLVNNPAERAQFLGQLHEAENANRPSLLYELAQIFFSSIVQAQAYSAVDPGAPGSRYPFDLNLPVPIDEQFDLTLNIGTAEHIFNVYQFFKTVHERTLVGGLMMHSSPFTGWVDHGFFNLQPTFFFDLARANQYEVLSFILGKLNPFEYVQVAGHEQIPELLRAGKIVPGMHISVVFRKTAEAEFSVPVQGYYAGTLSKKMQQAWRELR